MKTKALNVGKVLKSCHNANIGGCVPSQKLFVGFQDIEAFRRIKSRNEIGLDVHVKQLSHNILIFVIKG
jgi:hypothetical protein